MDASSPITTTDESSLRYEGWRIVARLLPGRDLRLGVRLLRPERLSRRAASRARLAGLAGVGRDHLLLSVRRAASSSSSREAVRKFGPRNCLIAGTCATALAAVGIGQVNAPWQLYLANAVLAFGWAGMSLGMITNTLGLWFDQQARHGDQPGAERRQLRRHRRRAAAGGRDRLFRISEGDDGRGRRHGRAGGADRADRSSDGRPLHVEQRGDGCRGCAFGACRSAPARCATFASSR